MVLELADSVGRIAEQATRYRRMNGQLLNKLQEAIVHLDHLACERDRLRERLAAQESFLASLGWASHEPVRGNGGDEPGG